MNLLAKYDADKVLREFLDSSTTVCFRDGTFVIGRTVQSGPKQVCLNRFPSSNECIRGMPDVSRSDSQRSDSSQRPRVSFNRDVHVKRIGHPGTPRVVGALVGDGEGHLIPLTVRRERPTRLSRKELAKEARRVLDQVDSVNCTSRSSLDFQNTKSNNKRRFNTLPPIRSKKNSGSINSGNNSPSSSLDRSKQRNLVTSIFSSLDRAKVKKNKNKVNDLETKSKLSKKSSSSLSDLARTSSSSPERLTDFKRRKTELTRSISDADKYKKSNSNIEKSSNFLSLDRLLVKRNKNRAKNRSEFSDKSPSPPPRHRKGLQRKSYSDSEAADISTAAEYSRAELGINKKQLSPIIEVSPREDYFGPAQSKIQGAKENIIADTEPENLSEKTMHSSQITSRPPLTRGKTVNLMVKRLSQDPSLNRGPPRTLNASSGLVTPGEDRQHNNNLPFSYTEPTLRAVTPTLNERDNSTPTYTALNSKVKLPTISDNDYISPTTAEGQVIYAEVVVSGGGNGMPSKQTIHTQVPPVKQFSSDKVKNNQVQVSDIEEDEGLGLSMDTSNRYGKKYNDYSKSEIHSYAKWGSKDDSFTKGFLKASNNKGHGNFNGNDNNQKNSSSKYQISIERDQKKNNSRKDYAFQESKYESNDYIFDSSGRGRADGMDCLKSNHVTEGYDAFEDDLVVPTIKKNILNDFSKNKSYKSEYHSDDINGNQNYKKYDIKNDTIMHSRINSSDLSSRRDRLESRIESQRRERLINSKLYHDKDYSLPNRKHTHQNDALNDPKSVYHNRRDFLNSQIDFDKNSDKMSSTKHQNTKNFAKNSRYIESFSSEIEGHNKTEIFADSGIETDYRKDSTCHNSYNKYDRELLNDEHKGQRSGVSVNGHQSPITKVQLNGVRKLAMSDEEDNVVHAHNYISNTENHVAYNKRNTNNSFMSTKLIQEQKRTTEALPASAVLVRHYSPDIKNGIHSKVDESLAEYSNSEDEYKDNRDDERNKTEEYILSKERDNFKRKTKHSVADIRKSNESPKRNQSSKDDSDTDTKKTKKKQVSAMNKMKQLFSRTDTRNIKKSKKDGKKGDKLKEKVGDEEEEDNEEEDPLAARYTEYRGSDIEIDKDTIRLKQKQRYATEFDKYEGIKKSDYQQTRQRLATPSPSPSPPYSQQSSVTLARNNNNSNSGGNHWFKSLDRLKNGKAKKKVKDIAEETTEDEMQVNSWKPASQTNKNLRFFGDTDQESLKSAQQPTRRYKSNNTTVNSSNRLQVPQRGGLKNHHRLHRSAGDVATSSAESTTEGDSSQHSQRSVVYLHAATVGDIPGPNKGGSRRALSREELSSLASSNRLKPQTRTVSRSISVLAPWKPRHYREGFEVRYDNEDPSKAGGKGEGKPPKIPASHNLNGNSTTLSRATRRKVEENGRSASSEKHKYKSMSSESLSYGDYSNKNYSKEQLSKKKQSPMSASYESLTYNGTTRDKKTNSKTNSALNVSAMELNSINNNKTSNSRKYVNDNKKSSTKLKRSASVPKDSKSTGWFKLRSKK